MDDREFSEYRNFSNYSNDKNYITFQEYVAIVVEAGPKRSSDFQSLVNFFTLPVLEMILEGKTIIEARSFLTKPGLP